MNRVFKRETFFLPQEAIFSKKTLEKLNRFHMNFGIFSNNYWKIFNFYATSKSRKIFSEFCYLGEKFTVEAQGTFWRERPGHLKAIKRPRRGSAGECPPDGSEVSFFKTIGSIWKWIHLSKMSTFLFPKRPIFSKKNLEKLNRFLLEFLIFSKN